ncbi:MAG: L,D-transpeptidase [Thermoflexales bacterium]|nr:L,D-transpeptidase [Thermoflexales bacterium]MDW8352327.1 L,D-transpeptidase [Anaerolineae bacterium]
MNLSRRTLLKLGSLGLLRALLPPLPAMDFYTDGEPAQPMMRRMPIAFARSLQFGAVIRSEPDLRAPKVGTLRRDDVLPIYAEWQTESGSPHNKLWYEVEGGYLHSSLAQPVRWQLNRPVTDAGEHGFWAEVTVPFVDARVAPSVKAALTRYRYYGGTVYRVIQVVKSQDTPADVQSQPLPFSGDTTWWYRIEDESFPGPYFVPASHLRPISHAEFAPLSPEVDPREKKIVVRLSEQRLYAYEKGREVFTCRIASGAYLKDTATGELKDYTTTRGVWYVYRKTPSQHMYGGAVGNEDAFDLPGIPWVSYFTYTGIAVHGTYWHNDYGMPRSHGCVNVRSEDAKWVWRWTLPPNDYKERYAMLPAKERRNPALGTTVVVE